MSTVHSLPNRRFEQIHGTQRVGAFVRLPSMVQELGADPARVLSDAGLSPDALTEREDRISYAAVGRLLQAGVLHTGRTHFGLLVGRLWHVADLGLLGEIMLNSETVGDALRQLAAFQRLNSGGVVAFLRDGDAVVDFGCAIYEPGLIGFDQAGDMYMAAAVNFLRELCGPDWSPSEVFLPHSEPEDLAQHRSFLRVRPQFNADLCAVRFRAHWLQRPIAGADSERLRLARQSVRADSPLDIRQAVSRTLRVLLLEGECSGDEVANHLGMHRRTLNRRLKDVGTTFQVQLDAVRREQARQLLASSDIALDDIAGALGYSGVGPFMRACKRWTGTTPSKWRQSARNESVMSRHPTDDDGPRRHRNAADSNRPRMDGHGDLAA